MTHDHDDPLSVVQSMLLIGEDSEHLACETGVCLSDVSDAVEPEHAPVAAC